MTETQNPKQTPFDPPSAGLHIVNLEIICYLVLVFCYFRFIRCSFRLG